jgi:proteasome lid subunit RPN8/RPN11
MSAIELPTTALETIARHAAETYPDECCGALIGTSADGRSTVHEAEPLDNVTEEGPRRRFRVSARDYMRAESEARARGADLIGFYHSHPDHPARPSQYDLDHAWPNFSYVIIAVDAGTPGDLRSWRLRGERAVFEEEIRL